MSDAPKMPAVKTLRQLHNEHIGQVLRSVGGDLDKASRILGISVASLRRRIRRYEIPYERVKSPGGV